MITCTAPEEGGMKSYAQAKEDVLLWRALASRVHHDVGFWIDVGAYDPHVDSVTKEFSNHGWRGINIEPIEATYRRLVDDRPNDINIQAVVSDQSGEVTFHEIVGHQLGTLEQKFADRHAAAGFERRSYNVPALTLTQICEQHAPDQIHFLKIDVEGHEGKVIAGMDFTRFRPWILVIEAAEPNNIHAPTYDEWDGAVIRAGYRFLYTDLLNRYYVAEEHPELFPAFSFPADDYILASVAHRMAELEREVEALRHENERLRSAASNG
jgi:FkbM family methyltransferase